jgi:hypothetical protein
MMQIKHRFCLNDGETVFRHDTYHAVPPVKLSRPLLEDTSDGRPVASVSVLLNRAT